MLIYMCIHVVFSNRYHRVLLSIKEGQIGAREQSLENYAVVIYISRTDKKNMESISRFSLQVVASEENRDPPSEQSLPRRPDGLNSELANHLSNITLRLAFTEQERKV